MKRQGKNRREKLGNPFFLTQATEFDLSFRRYFDRFDFWRREGERKKKERRKKRRKSRFSASSLCIIFGNRKVCLEEFLDYVYANIYESLLLESGFEELIYDGLARGGK